MSSRRAVPETFRQFCCRRYDEIEKSDEQLDQFGKMKLPDLYNVLRKEFYDCAFDPVPPAAPRLH